MTYIVSSGTLNPTILYYTILLGTTSSALLLVFGKTCQHGDTATKLIWCAL